MSTLDCRTLPCPAPVLAVKKALQSSQELQVLLDDGAPRENVSRFARNRGYTVQEERCGDTWQLTISGENRQPESTTEQPDQLTVMLVGSDALGKGPEALGKLLMKTYLTTLVESPLLPSRMLFLNSGVLLTCAGSEVLEPLEKLAGMGVEIYSCGLCLDYFSLKEKLCVGATTNMFSTIENLLTADKVINLL